MAKTIALSTGKNGKCKPRKKSEKDSSNFKRKIERERQLEFQKQLLELSNRSNPIENKFSFSQNTIWSAIENFSYNPKEDIAFASYFRRYEDLYTSDCANLNDSKKYVF